ncbi:MAG: TrbG/VirB9 family P-type conjugative transfer protein [Bacteriovorax sp.]
MDFYILAKSMIYLFLSFSHPTTLVFDEPVEYVSAGKEGDFNLHRANNQKILVVRPLKAFGETDMIVITKDHHYQFKLKEVQGTQNPDQSHSFVNIHSGEINRSFVKKLETENFKIFEGESSSWVVNKSKKAIQVNGVEVIREGYFSKGSPLLINNQRVLN